MPAQTSRTGPERADAQRHVRARVRRAQLEEHLAAAGRAYDLFGNGKTAVKFTAGRYLEAPLLISFTRVANPAAAITTNATRTWADINGDFLPQENELGALNSSTFGQSVITTRYDDEVPKTRGYNWEISTSVQHELVTRVSMNVGYFRRWYGNKQTTDNVLIGPEDHDPFCATAPVDSRLPDGGGYQVCGLYNISRAKFGQVSNLVRLSEHYGEDKEIYDGVDVYLERTAGARYRGPGRHEHRANADRPMLRRGLSPGAAELQERPAVPDADQVTRRLPAAVVRNSNVGHVPEHPGSPDHGESHLHQRRGPWLARSRSVVGGERHRRRPADRSGHDVRRSYESARLPGLEDLQTAAATAASRPTSICSTRSTRARCWRRTTRTDRRGFARPTSSRGGW